MQYAFEFLKIFQSSHFNINVGVTAWCLAYVSVTFTVMRDSTSLNSGGYHTKKQCHTSRVTYPDPAGWVVTTGYLDPVPGEIPYPSHL